MGQEDCLSAAVGVVGGAAASHFGTAFVPSHLGVPRFRLTADTLLRAANRHHGIAERHSNGARLFGEAAQQGSLACCRSITAKDRNKTTLPSQLLRPCGKRGKKQWFNMLSRRDSQSNYAEPFWVLPLGDRLCCVRTIARTGVTSCPISMRRLVRTALARRRSNRYDCGPMNGRAFAYMAR